MYKNTNLINNVSRVELCSIYHTKKNHKHNSCEYILKNDTWLTDSSRTNTQGNQHETRCYSAKWYQCLVQNSISDNVSDSWLL
jgi:hypothetical protein